MIYHKMIIIQQKNEKTTKKTKNEEYRFVDFNICSIFAWNGALSNYFNGDSTTSCVFNLYFNLFSIEKKGKQEDEKGGD